MPIETMPPDEVHESETRAIIVLEDFESAKLAFYYSTNAQQGFLVASTINGTHTIGSQKIPRHSFVCVVISGLPRLSEQVELPGPLLESVVQADTMCNTTTTTTTEGRPQKSEALLHRTFIATRSIARYHGRSTAILELFRFIAHQARVGVARAGRAWPRCRVRGQHRNFCRT
jgi:hypothetical protein